MAVNSSALDSAATVLGAVFSGLGALGVGAGLGSGSGFASGAGLAASGGIKNLPCNSALAILNDAVGTVILTKFVSISTSFANRTGCSASSLGLALGGAAGILTLA